jgi:hypothetical protein
VRHVAVAVVSSVHRTIGIRTDMQRGVDALRHDHLRLKVWRNTFVAGITDPAGLCTFITWARSTMFIAEFLRAPTLALCVIFQ